VIPLLPVEAAGSGKAADTRLLRATRARGACRPRFPGGCLREWRVDDGQWVRARAAMNPRTASRCSPPGAPAWTPTSACGGRHLAWPALPGEGRV